MAQIYISRGKRFYWKAIAIAHLIDELDPCPQCGGNGYDKFSSMFDQSDKFDEQGKCLECNGRGKVAWLEPIENDSELQKTLQKCLDQYLAEREQRKAMAFIGANI